MNDDLIAYLIRTMNFVLEDLNSDVDYETRMLLQAAILQAGGTFKGPAL
jgi:hypothetical protein